MFLKKLALAHRGTRLTLDTPVPDHSAFPLYGPSFTLEILPGNMKDENTDEYIHNLKEIFSAVCCKIRDAML